MGDNFSVTENDGSILNIDVQDINLGENQGNSTTSGTQCIYLLKYKYW